MDKLVPASLPADPDLRFRQKVAVGLVLAAIFHQWVFCFGVTAGMPFNGALLGLFEGLIYLVAFWACGPSYRPATLAVFLGIVTYLFVSRGLSAQMPEIKIIRDCLIPLLFYELGVRVQLPLHAVKRMGLGIAVVAAAVSGVEFLLQFDYYRFFSTMQYYASTGTVNPEAAQVSDQVVTLNGLRPEGIGRTFLSSILGSGRYGGIMLEPVSLANLGIILTALALCERRLSMQNMAVIGLAWALFLLADARFGSTVFTLIFLAAFIVPVRLVNFVIAFAPIAAMSMLAAVALNTPRMKEDSFLGRLNYSGYGLVEHSWAELLAWDGNHPGWYDAGYSYLITRLGLPLVLLMWALLLAAGNQSDLAKRYKLGIGLYVAALVAISGTSAFALKTAALAWFVFGTLSAQPPGSAAPASRREREERALHHRLSKGRA